ncbi:helix-turn-helix domain-containing protein [Kineosporia babensis]|uniref:Helix-turn-helix transcriptional regulator n=1 Tax=Kineosporia babensis TaxID=499548 RepID=A0A9X1SSR6_9ACTN|nr:helix-turn-helix transcriptional regulator [Kineosporia babensis]MCD5310869.1 helix-turn-helix transcriptional regulator [Kineosporia babensis]
MAVEEVFARAIAAERAAHGWEQKDLAQATGLSPSIIARIETAKRSVSLREAMRIAEALDVTIDHLLRRAEPEDRSRFGLRHL